MTEEKRQKRIEHEKALIEKLSKRRQSTFEKFPLLFTMLSSFGLVATFYGFERLIDNVEFLSNNPWVLLTVGIFILMGTGTLYSKLS